MNQQRLIELKRMPYADYLQTPEWTAKRELVLDRDSHCCHVCSSRESLNVHHLTYDRRGNEDLDDLVALCKTCHSCYHQSSMICPDHLRDWPGDTLFKTFDLLSGTISAFVESKEVRSNPFRVVCTNWAKWLWQDTSCNVHCEETHRGW